MRARRLVRSADQFNWMPWRNAGCVRPSKRSLLSLNALIVRMQPFHPIAGPNELGISFFEVLLQHRKTVCNQRPGFRNSALQKKTFSQGRRRLHRDPDGDR